MLKRAVDISHWTVTSAEDPTFPLHVAQALVDEGHSRVIVGTQIPARTQQQLDVFDKAGVAERHAYTYFRFDRDPVLQSTQGIEALGGRPVDMLWLDFEDDTASALSVEDTVKFMRACAAAHEGIVFTGIYTRRDWWRRQSGDDKGFAQDGFKLWDATNDKTPDLGFMQYGGWERPHMEQYAFDAPYMGLKIDFNVYALETVEPDVLHVVDMSSTPPSLTLTQLEVAGALAARGLSDHRLKFLRRDEGGGALFELYVPPSGLR